MLVYDESRIETNLANRRGMKVEAMSLADLAAHLANDEITLLEDTALIERAMTSVVTDLREGRRAQA